MFETVKFLSEIFFAEVFCPKLKNAEVFDVNVNNSCQLNMVYIGL